MSQVNGAHPLDPHHVIDSTVVIWSGDRGSYEDLALLFAESLHEDLCTRGAVGQWVMDEPPESLKQCTPLLPTGVPNGLDAAPRSTRYRRQTRQVHQRLGHEDQTPMVPHGFGTPPAILIEAQVPLPVLIKRFRRPPVQRPADAPRGVPVHPVRHQHHIPSRQLRSFETDYDPDLAQAWDADPQREAPIGLVADGDGAIRIGRDPRHQLFDRDVGPRQLQRPAVGIPQLEAGRLQQAVLCEQAEPVLPPPGQDLDPRFREIPGVEHHHPQGHLGPDGLFDQRDGQRKLGPKRLMARPKLGIRQQPGVHLLVQAVARRCVGRDLEVGKMLGHGGFPLGQLVIAAIQAQA